MTIVGRRQLRVKVETAIFSVTRAATVRAGWPQFGIQLETAGFTMTSKPAGRALRFSLLREANRARRVRGDDEG